MKKTIRTVTAVLLAVCLIAGSGAAAFAAGFEGYEPLEHRPLTESDLQYKGWDDDKFDALLERLEAMGADTPDSEFLDVRVIRQTFRRFAPSPPVLFALLS